MWWLLGPKSWRDNHLDGQDPMLPRGVRRDPMRTSPRGGDRRSPPRASDGRDAVEGASAV